MYGDPRELTVLPLSFPTRRSSDLKAGAYPAQLSCGQQQRVAIARSLAMQPKLMLFDEVTSALDPQITGEVLKVIASLANEGMTMVLVTHEMDFAKTVADHILSIHEGLVWESGDTLLLTNTKTAKLKKYNRNRVKKT